MVFNNNLKKILEDKNISQHQVARDLGKNVTQINRLVNKKSLSSVSLKTLFMFSEYLDVELHQLYE